MKMEFLREGSPDCPLIRLFSFHRSEAISLYKIVAALSTGSLHSAPLHSQPWIEPIGSCQLSLCLSEQDRGILSTGPSTFECVLSAMAWDNVAGLIEPFCHSDASTGYQWLTRASGTALLLSTDGLW
jgi:hypothetical protein